VKRAVADHQRLQQELDSDMQRNAQTPEQRGDIRQFGEPMTAGNPEPGLERNQKMVWQRLLSAQRQAYAQMRQQNEQLRESFTQFGQGVRTTFDGVSESLRMLGQRHSEVYRQIGATLEQSIAREAEAAKQSGAGAMSMMQKAIGAIKELAPVKAAEDTAKGLEALGDFNLWSATQYFAAAAMWGVVSASQVSSMVSAATGGGGSRGRRGAGGSSRYSASGSGGGAGSGGGSGSGQQVTPGGNAPTAPSNGNLTIAIMGDQESGQWLANTLNRVVQQGGAQLTATRTTAIPSPMA
jgi:hypothetical protein